ncbi:hypothetical protein [Patulibacter americanus]|uniref:hypothetical protein n=1 Tax=Patulibacter americanus TaxID=588672 RepID=UPI0012FB31B9|nr:hypothetical protein [Patulibacter americanus]
MSDPQLDDALRALGDDGLEPRLDASVARLNRRLAHDLSALNTSGAIGTTDASATPGAPRATEAPGRRGSSRPAGHATTGRRHRVLVAAVASLATAATFTATAAVALTATTGSPVPPFARGDTTNVFPDPGTDRVTDARSPDPTGGPPWAVRVGRTADGLVCVGTGQVAPGGAFGVRGLDGRFRALPPFGNDACGPAPRTGRPLVQLRGFSGPGSRSPTGATSVVFGSGGPDLRSVQIAAGAGAPQPVRIGDSGTFVLAVAGLPEGAAPRVQLRWDDGTERTVQLGRNSSVPDPEGRVGWTASTTFSGPGGCATVAILRVQGSGGAKVCGPLGGRQATLAPVRAMHRVGPRSALLVRRDEGDRIVVRLRGREVATVTVRMAGRMRTTTSRTLVRDRAGRRRIAQRTVRTPGPGPAASVAILPAGVRPADLRVEALRDGRIRALPVAQTRTGSPSPSRSSSPPPTGGR